MAPQIAFFTSQVKKIENEAGRNTASSLETATDRQTLIGLSVVACLVTASNTTRILA